MAIDLTKIGIYSGINDSVQKISNLRLGKSFSKKVVTQVYAGVNDTPQLVYDFLDEIEYMVIVFDTVQRYENIVNEGDSWYSDEIETNKSDSLLGATLTFTNPTADDKYYTNFKTSSNSRGGDFSGGAYFKLKNGEYIAFETLAKKYLSTHEISLYTSMDPSWSSSGGYSYGFLGYAPWDGYITSSSSKTKTHSTIDDFPGSIIYSGGYNITITTILKNLTINGNKYPIIIIDKIKVSDTDEFFWLDNKCFAFSPGMTWADFIDNSDYDRGSEFAKYTAKNLIKYKTCLKEGTYYIKDQVLSDTIQATTYELMNANELLTAGSYWVIDQNGTTAYDSSGVAWDQSNNTSSWTCPIKGTYKFELHGKGGDGGTGIANYHMVHNITYDFGSERMAGAGGGGGGSGVRYSSISLVKGDTFSITWTGGVTSLIGASKTYYCNPGENGGNGSAPDPWSSSISATGGTRGSRNTTYTSGGTQLASHGQAGDAEWYYGNSGATGGAGGSGGATVGSYGNGGNGADVPGGTYWSWEYNQVESETYNGSQGQPGAIIITYQS